MATIYTVSPDIFAVGSLAAVGAVDGGFFAEATPSCTCEAPSFGGRSGANTFEMPNNLATLRFVFPSGGQSEIILHVAYYFPSLPTVSSTATFQRTSVRDADNVSIVNFDVSTTGNIIVRNPGGTVLATTALPAIVAGSWILLEFRVRIGAGTGEVEIRDAGNAVLLLAQSLALGASQIAQIAFDQGGTGLTGYHISDIWVKNLLGSRNNTFGARGIYARRLISDNPGNGWGVQARTRIGNGVLRSSPTGFSPGQITLADNAALEIGAQSFTIEGFFRWSALPASGQTWTLFSKWGASANTRSFQLVHSEATGAHRLQFNISTLGTAASVTTIHDVLFTPVLNRWYHIAVNRNGTANSIYIDGVRVGPVITDGSTYFNGAAVIDLVINGAANNADNPRAFNGFLDEVRYTVAASRYPAEFTPTGVPFLRTPADPLWNNTQLLLGFDNNQIVDESQFGRAVTVNIGGTPGLLPILQATIPEDGAFGFQSIDRPLRDDTFIEAPFLPAFGTLQFVGQPTAAQTVTIGSRTYTYVAALTAANQVLIGPDFESSLTNLRSAINQTSGAGTTYGTGTVAHPDVQSFDQAGVIIRLEARTAGSAGNAITLSTTVTGAIVSGATLTGGADIPAASEFGFETLPAGVTAISAVCVATRRQAIGGGVSNLQVGIRDAGGTLINGQDTVAPASPAWLLDIFDSAPGGASWSTTALIGARVRDNRTV